MANKVLSVVVPTYNMEAYLPRCLDSVTREDVPDTLEVIVVNDGSKDRSLEIAKEYQAKRPDIISIIDKPNGHYGSCINAALKVATGKYFRPLDADDWFDTDALINFLKELEDLEVDLVISNYICYRKTRTVSYLSRNVDYSKVYTKNNFKIFKQQNDNLFEMHAFTYNLDLLSKANLKLSEGVCYTDTQYVFFPLRYLKTFTFVNTTLYQYNTARDGQSISASVLKKNCVQQAELIKGLLSSRDCFSNIERIVICHFLKNFIYRLLFCFRNDSILKEINCILTQKDKKLQNMVDTSLFYSFKIWRLTGIHFFFYERIKTIFKIDR